MNISIDCTQHQESSQTIPEYDQNAESVTEISVDNTNIVTKSILKNKGTTTYVALSPSKDQIPNPISAGNPSPPTTEMEPDFHPNANVTSRPTTEAVNPAHLQKITATTISMPQTRRIKSSLLLQPILSNGTSVSASSYASQSENEVEVPGNNATDETNVQCESPSVDVNDTPVQDEPQS